ncbi:MAG: YqaA family protein [Methyloligellaceae bacterium]
MISALYYRTLQLAEKPYATWALGVVSFLESSIFPIPPDVLLIPMVLANRAKAWFLAGLATITSVIGGIAGYMIGLFLFDLLGQPLLEFYGYADKFEQFAQRYNDFGAWIVFIAGVTPFPYKVITIASGATQLNFMVFLLASIAARGLRFFIVSGLLYWFGPPIREFIEKRLGLMFAVFCILLVGGFIVAKYAI